MILDLAQDLRQAGIAELPPLLLQGVLDFALRQEAAVCGQQAQQFADVRSLQEDGNLGVAGEAQRPRVEQVQICLPAMPGGSRNAAGTGADARAAPAAR
jgi:hypothetical protein